MLHPTAVFEVYTQVLKKLFELQVCCPRVQEPEGAGTGVGVGVGTGVGVGVGTGVGVGVGTGVGVGVGTGVGDGVGIGT